MRNLYTLFIYTEMRYLFFILLVSLFFSCSNSQHPLTQVENVILDLDLQKELKLSSIADSIEVIPFEQTEYSDIAQIRRIIPYKDRYYILNTVGFINGTLLVFDKKGNFIYKLDKRGGGEGEYVNLQDFTINPQTDELVLLTFPKTIYLYDLNGNYKSKLECRSGDENISIDSIGNIYSTGFCTENNPNRLSLINSQNIHFFAPITDTDFVRVNHHTFTNEFDSYKGEVFYSFPYCDTIFNVTGGYKKPIYYINYKDLKFPVKDVFTKNRRIEDLEPFEKEFSKRLRTDIFQFTNDYLYIGSVDGERHGFISLYSFRSKKTLVAHRIIDDMFFPNNSFVLKPFRLPIEVEGNYLLWFVRPSWLLNGYEAYKNQLNGEEWKAFCSRNPEIIRICEQLDDESNPVLLKIKVKDF